MNVIEKLSAKTSKPQNLRINATYNHPCQPKCRDAEEISAISSFELNEQF
jgi:hypothetical protein